MRVEWIAGVLSGFSEAVHGWIAAPSNGWTELGALDPPALHQAAMEFALKVSAVADYLRDGYPRRGYRRSPVELARLLRQLIVAHGRLGLEIEEHITGAFSALR